MPVTHSTSTKTGGKAKPKQGTRKRATSQVDNDHISKKQWKAAMKGDDDEGGEGKKEKKEKKRVKQGPARKTASDKAGEVATASAPLKLTKTELHSSLLGEAFKYCNIAR